MYNKIRSVCKNEGGVNMRKYITAIMIVLCLSLIIACFTYKSNATGLDVLTNPSEYIQNNDDNAKAVEIRKYSSMGS